MHDLRLAIRTLRATPVVSAVAVLSLALGIGANTAMFSIVDSLVLRALPVANPQRLAILTGGGSPNNAYSYSAWRETQQRATGFDGLCAWTMTRFNIASAGETHLVDGLYVSGEFFSTLRVPALMGRTLDAADDQAGSENSAVAVISYGMWQRQFGGASDVLGRPLLVERTRVTVVGVTRAEFFGPEVGRAFDVALPIAAEGLIRGTDGMVNSRTTWWLTVMVRLRNGSTLQQGTTAIRTIQPAVREAALPAQLSPRAKAAFLNSPWTLVSATAGTSRLRAQYEKPVIVLFIIVGLVLLIACANVAHLLFARATSRRHEFSLRVALGASRWRLVRQLLAESLVLGACGTVAGIAVAPWAGRFLVRQLSTDGTVSLDLSVHASVLLFTATVAGVTVLLFGVAPAIRASAVAPIDALKEQGSTGVGDGSGRWTNGLVVAQVAFCVVLVVGTGLFVRTFVKLAQRPLGFDPSRVLVVQVDLTRTASDPVRRAELFGSLARAAAALPGVASVSASLTTPLSGGLSTRLVETPVVGGRATDRVVSVNFVGPGWFGMYGTPLLRGRDVNAYDTVDAPPVAVVNEAFVRKFFGDRDPVGQSIMAPAPISRGISTPRMIVGTAADAVYFSLREPIQPTLYIPLSQFDFVVAFGGGSLSMRAISGSPAMLTRLVAAALTNVAPDATLDFRVLTDRIRGAAIQERVLALLSAFFGSIALLLAALGLYGVTSYAVVRRRREIGIRIAIGGPPIRIIGLVVSRLALLVLTGVVAGTAASVWASKFVAALLYGVEPRDPMTVVTAVTTFAMVALVAGGVPAYRAARLDPVETLRQS